MAKRKSRRQIDQDAVQSGIEQTAIQLPGSAYTQNIDPFSGALARQHCEPHPHEVEAIRQHPTVWFAQYIALAPLLESGWSVQADSTDEDVAEIADVIKKVILPWCWHIIERCLFGQHEYGWQAFELVDTVDEIDGRLVVVPGKIKELIQDYPTEAVVSPNGDLIGFRQNDVDIPVNKTLYIAQRVRGSNHYGQSSYRAVKPLVLSDSEVSDHANRHDKWSSGSKVLVRYPVGTSLVTTSGGTATARDNMDIAKAILNALKHGEGAAMPAGRTEGSNSWDITHVSDPVSHETRFTNRQRFLDTRILHIFLVPERSATEGQFGTKAEAGTHSDLGLQLQFIQHAKITEAVSDQVVDRMILQNWGKRYVGRVKVVPAPLDDQRQKFYQQLYMKLLDSDELAFMERQLIDMIALRTNLSIPLRAGANEEELLREMVGVKQAANDSVTQPQATDAADEDVQTADNTKSDGS